MSAISVLFVVLDLVKSYWWNRAWAANVYYNMDNRHKFDQKGTIRLGEWEDRPA